MKGVKVLTGCLVFLLMASMSVWAAGGENKTRVAVIEFENKSTWHWSQSGAPGELLVTKLVKSGAFSVIEREKLDKIMQEQNLGQSGAVTAQTAAQIGKILGLNYIITGAVTEWSTTDKGGHVGGTGVGVKSYTASVDVRVIDVNTAEIVAAVTGEGRETGFSGSGVLPVPGLGGVSTGGGEGYSEKRAAVALRDAVDKAGDQIIQQMSGAAPSASPGVGMPKVAKVDGKKVTINKGTGDGIQVGQVFGVYALGEEIKDPDTGQTLSQEENKIGTVKVASVQDKISVCDVVSGSGFASGNFLKAE